MAYHDLGEFARASLQSMPWLNNTTKKGKNIKRRKDDGTLLQNKINLMITPESRTYVYPRYKDMTIHIPDEEWKAILLDMARGLAPRNCSCTNEEIVFHMGTKHNTLYLSGDDVIAAKEVIDFLRHEAGIKSTNDKLSEKLLYQELAIAERENITKKSWTDISEKSKLPAISDYVKDKMASQWKLTTDEINTFITIIYLSIMNGVLRSEDINYNNCSISSINGMSFDEDNRYFLINKTSLSRQHYPKLKGVIPHTVYLKPSYVTSGNKGFNKRWKTYLSDVSKSKKCRSGQNNILCLMQGDTARSQASYRSPEV